MGRKKFSVGYCKYCYEDTPQHYVHEIVPLPEGGMTETRQLRCMACDAGLAPAESVRTRR